MVLVYNFECFRKKSQKMNLFHFISLTSLQNVISQETFLNCHLVVASVIDVNVSKLFQNCFIVVLFIVLYCIVHCCVLFITTFHCCIVLCCVLWS